MRTLSEIIEAAKSNSETTHEECLYALLAMEALFFHDNRTVRKYVLDPDKSPVAVLNRLKLHVELSFQSAKAALNKSPKEYVGAAYDPKNPEYQKMRTTALKIFDKIVTDQDN